MRNLPVEYLSKRSSLDLSSDQLPPTRSILRRDFRKNPLSYLEYGVIYLPPSTNGNVNPLIYLTPSEYSHLTADYLKAFPLNTETDFIQNVVRDRSCTFQKNWNH